MSIYNTCVRWLLAASVFAAVAAGLSGTVHAATRTAAALTPEAVWEAIDANTVTGTTYNCRTIEISHERSFRPIGEFGICDGTNPIDGNRIPSGQPGAGYPAMDQPGRATDADGDGVYEPSPCYAWNNTLNGAKLNMTLRRWDPQQTALQAAHVREGRDFFNAEPKPEDYKPYTYPHPLQAGWDALMKRAAERANAGARDSRIVPAGKQ
jgi:hypothetical protein